MFEQCKVWYSVGCAGGSRVLSVHSETVHQGQASEQAQQQSGNSSEKSLNDSFLENNTFMKIPCFIDGDLGTIKLL